MDLGERWEKPYISPETGKWVVMTKRPLSPEEIGFGLSPYVTGDTVHDLVWLVRTENRMFEDFRSREKS